MYALSFSSRVSFSIWIFVCGLGGVAAFGFAGMLGTLTLRICDRLTDVDGLFGFKAAIADIEGRVGFSTTSLVTCVVNGNTQNNASIPVHATAAGIQNPERVLESATLARIRVARCGGALIAW
jgi:hypothetical protein